MNHSSYAPPQGADDRPPPVPTKDGGPHSDPTQPQRKATTEMPRFGATFVPGGFDDYYMPEVVAPSPQRVMPEVPQNMQDGLQRMELEAREPSPGRNNQNNNNSNPAASSAQQGQPSPGQPTADFKPFEDDTTKYQIMSSGSFDGPSFSPFPKIKGDNIPPSDEEKEEILYNARQHVLHSNNVSMQLSWARDALNWVEVAGEAHMRENNGQMVRSSTPKVEHELRLDAIKIVEYLAAQGHPEGLFMRSKWLEFGKFGFRTDKKEAYLGYKKASEQAYGRAEYRMGMLYENSNEMEKAIKHYNLGLTLKDSAASYRMGMMNLIGQHGYKKDYQRGLELIQAAADTSDEDAPQGAYVYGMLISRDLPDITMPESILPVNLAIARQYIEKAAYLGFAKAQLKMGQAYELCQLGCDFNPASSLHYYGLAARQGQPEAALGVSRWFLFGYEGVFQKNEPLAFKYAKQAANAQLATGEFAIGYYYEIGIHVQKSVREARGWYEKASEHGNKDAKGRLASLDQEKTLTKADHETTALGRIKSQHGSQRGKRPDRFKQKDIMPTLTESAPSTPVDAPLPALPPKGVSPRQRPTNMGDSFDRQAPFTVNVDSSLAMRPKSTAPYPLDDRPEPLNLRPKSTAPYPTDDPYQSKPLSPYYNPQIRPSSSNGPQADRPGSAFGIKPPGGMPQSASTGSLVPPAGTAPPRGRVQSAGWEPQPPSGYRQPSPGPAQGHYQSQPPYDAGPQPPRQPLGAAAGGLPVGDPTRNRLSKQNPNPNATHQTGPAPSQYNMGHQASASQPYVMSGAQQGRDYGPRTSSRPVSDVYTVARPDRTDSLPVTAQGGHARLPSAGRPLKDRPGMMDTGGRSSAPPGQGGPMGRPPQSSTPTPSIASTTAAHGGPGRHGGRHKPQAQGQGQGPATFEEMGIPQGKGDDDCVVM